MGTIKDFFEQKLFIEGKKSQDGDDSHTTGYDKEESSKSPNRENPCFHAPREESEKVKQWREKQINLLAEKDKKEEKQKEEWIKSAKKELEAWYKQNADLISKLKKTNRELMKAETPAIDGHTPLRWENVCQYCDVTPAAMEASASKDRSRMLAVMLRLKTPAP